MTGGDLDTIRLAPKPPTDIVNIPRSLKVIDDLTLLPIEIGILVSDYLAVTELLAARKVSRDWRKYWGSTRILTQFFKSHFRIYFETHGREMPDLTPSFEEFVYQRHAAQLGRYCSMAIYSYNSQEYDPEILSLDHTYHNGRVAWSDDIAVYVTTLLTGITTQYLISETESVCYFWLNEDLLVCQSTQQNKLYAWSLDTNIKYSSSFPPEIKHITLSNSRVGVVTERDVMIWTIGDGIQKITIDITTLALTPKAVLFHPTSQDTIVLLSSHRIDSLDPKYLFTLDLIAQEYKNGAVQDICFFKVPFKSDPYNTQVQFDIRLIDNNGSYSICWLFEDIIDLSNVAHACSFKHHNDDDRSYYRLLSYDIYYKRFSLRCFARGRTPVDDMELYTPPGEFYSQVWADQMLTPVIDVGSSSNHFLFQNVRALDRVSNESGSVCFINGIKDSPYPSPNDDTIRKLEGEKHGLISYFTYVAEMKPSLEPWTDMNWSRRIRGDETFLVLLAEAGYVVWCFDKRVTLPSTNLLSKEFLVYKP